jgi:hypothetical protein
LSTWRLIANPFGEDSGLTSLSNGWALPTDVMESNKYGNGIYAFEMHAALAGEAE